MLALFAKLAKVAGSSTTYSLDYLSRPNKSRMKAFPLTIFKGGFSSDVMWLHCTPQNGGFCFGCGYKVNFPALD